MPVPSSDVAFSPSVKAAQARKGSRATYKRLEQRGSWRTTMTPDLAAFIQGQTSVFLATASAAGQPYIQHRGGPPGFLRVLDERTLGFADYSGNRQYITLGNLAENPRAQLFLIDYENRQRIKIWGEARVVEGDQELLGRLVAGLPEGRVEQAILFAVTAWDINCPKNIPQRFEAAKVEAVISGLNERIAQLVAELARLR